MSLVTSCVNWWTVVLHGGKSLIASNWVKQSLHTQQHKCAGRLEWHEGRWACHSLSALQIYQSLEKKLLCSCGAMLVQYWCFCLRETSSPTSTLLGCFSKIISVIQWLELWYWDPREQGSALSSPGPDLFSEVLVECLLAPISFSGNYRCTGLLKMRLFNTVPQFLHLCEGNNNIYANRGGAGVSVSSVLWRYKGLCRYKALIMQG